MALGKLCGCLKSVSSNSDDFHGGRLEFMWANLRKAMMNARKTNDGKAPKSREERLAAQLRANLARRKLQNRERREEEKSETAEKKPR
jgi:hypothetical protein